MATTLYDLLPRADAIASDLLLGRFPDYVEGRRLTLYPAQEEALIELGLKAHERFVREWVGGFLPLPRWVCSTEQLYRAFKRWCLQTGERFPPPQVTFSKGVEKAARGKLRCEPVKLDAEVNGKNWLRVWVVADADPPEGTSKGQWARESVEAFEDVLRRFGEHDAPGGGQ